MLTTVPYFSPLCQPTCHHPAINAQPPYIQQPLPHGYQLHSAVVRFLHPAFISLSPLPPPSTPCFVLYSSYHHAHLATRSIKREREREKKKKKEKLSTTSASFATATLSLPWSNFPLADCASFLVTLCGSLYSPLSRASRHFIAFILYRASSSFRHAAYAATSRNIATRSHAVCCALPSCFRFHMLFESAVSAKVEGNTQTRLAEWYETRCYLLHL